MVALVQVFDFKSILTSCWYEKCLSCYCHTPNLVTICMNKLIAGRYIASGNLIAKPESAVSLNLYEYDL